MAYNEFVTYIIEDQLGAISHIRAKAMFGGYGIYTEDIFFAIIIDDTLYFKVDESNRTDYEKHGCSPFTYIIKGKTQTMQYWNVPDDVLENRDLLTTWAYRAIDVAQHARTAKTEKKKLKKKNV